MTHKLTFQGTVLSVQPRIRLTRSFDEVSHSYLGYVLAIDGLIQTEQREFTIGIGKVAHEKHQFIIGDHLSGACEPVLSPQLEPAEFYKVSRIKKTNATDISEISPPPWNGICPDLTIYRERGHRRLATQTYNAKCTTCIWGCRMPVEIIVDNWNPKASTKYRYETFCYGPLNCKLYKAGPKRQVEGRQGMVYVEEDWVDEMNTEHRGMDE